MRLAIRAAGFFTLAATFLGSVWAQSYPNRAVTLVVPFAAGGPTDTVARTLGQSMTRTLGPV